SSQPDDIAAMMVTLAKAGKRVVWLKHGDASRPGREVAVCRTAGIEVELVPGIPTAPPAAASILLERFLALAANRRQRDQGAKRQRGNQQAEADWPL
ncbi:MAG: SAM-dependent methyltransferase, partial [Xanthobacteraceae bacterium]